MPYIFIWLLKMGIFIGLLTDSIAFGANHLWPLEVGSFWTYNINSTYPKCPSGEKDTRVLGEELISGRKAFKVQSACTEYQPGYFSVDGEIVEAEFAGTWWRIIDTPIADGHEWQEFRTTAVWTKIDSITVSAGTFTDCWRKSRKVTYTDWTEFCSGVGIVRSHMVDLGGGYIDLELKKYELQ